MMDLFTLSDYLLAVRQLRVFQDSDAVYHRLVFCMPTFFLLKLVTLRKFRAKFQIKSVSMVSARIFTIIDGQEISG